MTMRTLISIFALALVGALVLWGPAACNRYLIEKKVSEIESGQADATLDSIDVSNATVAEREALAKRIEADAKALADEVRAGPVEGSGERAVDAACQMETYKNTPACVQMGSPVNVP